MTQHLNIRNGILAVIVLGLLTVFFGSWYVVSETERVVVLRNGKFVEVAQPGLNFKIPMMDKTIVFSNETFTEEFNSLQAYSNDSQVATMRVSVTYMLPAGEVENAYREYKSLDNLVARTLLKKVPEANEQVFGQFTAERAVKERGILSAALMKRVSETLDDNYIRVVSVQLENVDFSDAYEKSIEDRMKAEVLVKTSEQNEKREIVEARIKVVQKQADADSNLALAEANAKGIEAVGAAEAAVIEAKAKALAQNPNLVQLTAAERWDGVMPTTMVPGGATPLINLSGANR